MSDERELVTRSGDTASGDTESGDFGSGDFGSDAELAGWMEEWREETAAGGEEAGAAGGALRSRLERRLRWRTVGLFLLTAGEWLFAAVALYLLVRLALTAGHPLDAALLIGFCLLVVGALFFGVWNRRGFWRLPGADQLSTREYLEQLERRCRRRLIGLRFGWGLLAVEVALFVPWLALRLGRAGAEGAMPYVQAYGYLALAVALAGGALAGLTRWTLGELERLRRLQRGEPPA